MHVFQSRMVATEPARVREGTYGAVVGPQSKQGGERSDSPRTLAGRVEAILLEDHRFNTGKGAGPGDVLPDGRARW